MRVTKTQATRKEHKKYCMGYGDCDCFSSLRSYKEVYQMQEELKQLKGEVKELRKALSNLVPQAFVTGYDANGMSEYEEEAWNSSNAKLKVEQILGITWAHLYGRNE